MEVRALCTRQLFNLLVYVLVSLDAHVQRSYSQTDDHDAFPHVIQARQQFFEYESLTFRCEASDASARWKGVKNTKQGFLPQCFTDTCTLEVYETDSGEYWCETERGERSNSVNITVTHGPVILESPAVPVTEGQSVTLRCRNKTDSANLQTNFHKNGFILKRYSSKEMTIDNVSKSDEGLYTCSISGGGTSPESWLIVREHKEAHTPPNPLLGLLWITVTLSLAALLVVGFLKKRRKIYGSRMNFLHYFSSRTPTAASESEVDNQIISGEETAEDENTVTYAVVVTKSRKEKDAADADEKSSQSRKPQAQKDENESSLHSVYSTIDATNLKWIPLVSKENMKLSRSTTTLNHRAEADGRSTQEEVVYSPVNKFAKRRNT